MQVQLSSTHAGTGWDVRLPVEARQQAVKVTGLGVHAVRMDSLVDDSLEFGIVPSPQCFRLATVVRTSFRDMLKKRERLCTNCCRK